MNELERQRIARIAIEHAIQAKLDQQPRARRRGLATLYAVLAAMFTAVLAFAARNGLPV